jgi:hypothetical protein
MYAASTRSWEAPSGRRASELRDVGPSLHEGRRHVRSPPRTPASSGANPLVFRGHDLEAYSPPQYQAASPAPLLLAEENRQLRAQQEFLIDRCHDLETRLSKALVAASAPNEIAEMPYAHRLPADSPPHHSPPVMQRRNMSPTLRDDNTPSFDNVARARSPDVYSPPAAVSDRSRPTTSKRNASEENDSLHYEHTPPPPPAFARLLQQQQADNVVLGRRITDLEQLLIAAKATESQLRRRLAEETERRAMAELAAVSSKAPATRASWPRGAEGPASPLTSSLHNSFSQPPSQQQGSERAITLRVALHPESYHRLSTSMQEAAEDVKITDGGHFTHPPPTGFSSHPVAEDGMQHRRAEASEMTTVETRGPVDSEPPMASRGSHVRQGETVPHAPTPTASTVTSAAAPPPPLAALLMSIGAPTEVAPPPPNSVLQGKLPLVSPATAKTVAAPPPNRTASPGPLRQAPPLPLALKGFVKVPAAAPPPSARPTTAVATPPLFGPQDRELILAASGASPQPPPSAPVPPASLPRALPPPAAEPLPAPLAAAVAGAGLAPNFRDRATRLFMRWLMVTSVLFAVGAFFLTPLDGSGEHDAAMVGGTAATPNTAEPSSVPAAAKPEQPAPPQATAPKDDAAPASTSAGGTDGGEAKQPRASWLSFSWPRFDAHGLA